jgi:K+-transporting ATPase ATPase C chain
VPAITRDLTRALLVFLAITVITGIVYPLVVTGIGQLAFNYQANGSLLHRNGTVVGSALIGQSFTGARWFEGRPSAVKYDGGTSGGSNLGPNSKALADSARAAALAAANANGVAPSAVPVDLVTASGSGLDPDISIQAARLQAPRVARARGIPLARVEQLIAGATYGRQLDFLGQNRVNVLRLNLALDNLRS